MSKNGKRIEGLQALRALAFLGIFTSHSCWNSQFGAWGVSIFFVLSGFLMTINYYDANFKISFKECFSFAWSKISKLYPLHIMMLVLAVPFEFNRSIQNGTDGIIYSFVKVFSSVSLIQSWIPDFWIYGSFNGVAWFLSACMFMYFCFPMLLKFIKRITNIKSYVLCGVMVYILQVTFLYLTRKTNLGDYPDANYWIAYTLPLTRLGDFFIGCNLGAIFRLNRDTTLSSFMIGSIKEIITGALIFISAQIYVILGNAIEWGGNWFRYTCLWIPTSCLVIWLFARKQGIISKVLSNKYIIWLGDISQYTFLIHNIVIIYTNMVVTVILQESLAINNIVVIKIIRTMIALVVTILGSLIWKRYKNVIFKYNK